MALMRMLAPLFLLAPLLFAGVGEITLIKGEALIKRAVAPVAATPETNATRDDQNRSVDDLNQTLAQNGEAVLPPVAEFEELNATVGMTLQEGDRVITPAKTSQVRLRMTDGTLITVGGASEFVIDAFDAEAPKAELNLAAGTLRTVTGQIGKIAPERFSLKTKTATIGIRGTDFITTLGAEGAVDAACLDGAIGVATGAGEVAVPAGQMTTALPGAVPAAPFAITAGVLGSLFGALGLDESEAAEVFERMNPPAPAAAEENNETNETLPVVPEEVNQTVAIPIAGELFAAQGAVAVVRASEWPAFSDANRTLIEGDQLGFVEPGRIKLLNGGEIQSGTGAKLLLNTPNEEKDAPKAPLTLNAGTLFLSGPLLAQSAAGTVTLESGAKAIAAVKNGAVSIVSLEGIVRLKEAAVENLRIQAAGEEAREYEAAELIALFEAAGLTEAEAKPYLPKPKAAPKPKLKIYKF